MLTEFHFITFSIFIIFAVSLSDFNGLLYNFLTLMYINFALSPLNDINLLKFYILKDTTFKIMNNKSFPDVILANLYLYIITFNKIRVLIYTIND